MAQRRRSGRDGHTRSAARTIETLREIIAEELVRIDDERLTFVTVTTIDVDAELNRGVVFFDSLDGPERDDEIVAALDELRPRLQSAIARQIRARKTPVLVFRPDEVLRSAERIDDILRADGDGTPPHADPSAES